jgi:hypothetical protein
VRGVEYKHTLVITLDGPKVFEKTIGGEEDMKAIDQQQAPAVAAVNGRFQNIPLNGDRGSAQGRRDVRRAHVRGIRRRALFVPSGCW